MKEKSFQLHPSALIGALFSYFLQSYSIIQDFFDSLYNILNVIIEYFDNL